MSIPLVSVCMITYNHEEYIEEAIQGVLNQNLDFNIEFVIANDASSDKTHIIILKLAQNTERVSFKYYNHSKNLGMMPNFLFALKKCSGKYIALCEGDDYWTDPLKLKKQVNFMEKNPDYTICFHEVQIYDQVSNALNEENITRDVLPTTTILDLARGNYIHTPSVLFQNNIDIPDWFIDSPLGDWTLYMLVVKSGSIHKIDDIMAVYRQHGESIWSKKSKEHRIANTLNSFCLVDENLSLPKETSAILKEKIKFYKKQLVNLKK